MPKEWLEYAAAFVEMEYTGYWLNSDHLAWKGLSRYHAPSCYPAGHIAEITVDHEASWDLSPRFDKEDVLELLPVDLNSNLAAYENDLAYFSEELGQPEAVDSWRDKAKRRIDTINELMWNSQDGLYYDFNFVRLEQKRVKSLATFFPLYHHIANYDQAQSVCGAIHLFERPYGLATCDQAYGYNDRQWNYPVGWAPLHLIAFGGLLNYRAIGTAHRIALKWLNLNLCIWNKTGKLFEKYDVENGSSNVLEDRYKNQEGFAWTNGVFYVLVCDLLKSIVSKDSI